MLKTLFARKSQVKEEAIVTAIVSQTSALIDALHQQIDLRFKELNAQVKEVELGLMQMEAKLLTKDLKDKQAYGLLHYKLHEAKNSKLENEIKELKDVLDTKKIF